MRDDCDDEQSNVTNKQSKYYALDIYVAESRIPITLADGSVIHTAGRGDVGELHT